ncbi:MAG: NUDIX domain-containing protein [Bacteroidales bacterium]|nr:NUDIX domain-containing protein [Bacteroidales bacterium]
MYSIYFNNRKLSVCPLKENTNYNSNAVVYYNSNDLNTKQLPEFMESNQKINLLVLPVEENKIDCVFEKICSEFNQINAGGGLVRNSAGEYLLIFRNGKWDLPKGKQEAGEDIKVTAVREVEEECGIDSLELGNLLCVTHHTYRMNGEFMLKHTFWYNMEYKGDASLKPQTEENIEMCKWVKGDEIAELVKDTYPSIKRVFEVAGL